MSGRISVKAVVESLLRDFERKAKNFEQVVREARRDCEAAHKVIRWIEDELERMSKEVLDGRVKAFLALERNRGDLAEEILILAEVQKVLMNELAEASKRIKEKVERVSSILDNVEKVINTLKKNLDLTLIKEVDVKAFGRVMRNMHFIMIGLIRLDSQLRRLNAAVNAGRAALERKREIMREGIVSTEVKKIIRHVGKGEIERKVREAIKQLKTYMSHY